MRPVHSLPVTPRKPQREKRKQHQKNCLGTVERSAAHRDLALLLEHYSVIGFAMRRSMRNESVEKKPLERVPFAMPSAGSEPEGSEFSVSPKLIGK